jgi:type I restriction enzyme, S subunit
LLADGDVVVARIGATTGKAYLVRDPPDAVFASYLIRLRPTPELDPVYLSYYLRSRIYWEQINANKGGRLKGGVNIPILQSLALPLPPLPEQRAIAHVLSTVQRAREATEAVIAATREVKRSLMRHLFTYGPVPVRQVAEVRLKEMDSGPVPEGWEVASLGTVARIERGKFSHRPRNDPAFFGGSVPFIQTGDVASCNGHIQSYHQTLNAKGLSVSRVFPTGTIVITIAANIGYTGILDFDSAFPDSLIGISPRGCSDREYLNYYLATQRDAIDRQAPRGTQKNINIQFLAPWPILVPPPSEQAAIVRTLRSVDAKLALEESRVHALNAIFQTLLHDLLTATRRSADV